jgi:hypothetical protein
MTRSFGTRLVKAIAVIALLAACLEGCSAKAGATKTGVGRAPRIAMRVLLITDNVNPSSASGAAYNAWVSTLKRHAVPFQSLVTSDASPGGVALPALSGRPNGKPTANYEGIVVATSGMEGLSAAQWPVVQDFEQKFGVRQVTAYAVPSGAYGLRPLSAANGGPLRGVLAPTPHGAALFPHLKAGAARSGAWGYEAPPQATGVDTLIAAPSGASMLGVYTASDGRQTMYQTFADSRDVRQSELLREGELAWLIRGTYIGAPRAEGRTRGAGDRVASRDQAAWARAGSGQITGYISGGTVTVHNAGTPTAIPITGTTIGSPDGGSRSGWVRARSGTSTFIALAAWPAPPAARLAVQVPTGPAPIAPLLTAVQPGLPGPAPLPAMPPSTGSAVPQQGSICIQLPPVIMALKPGMEVTPHLKCKAAFESTVCTGKVTITIGRVRVTRPFHIESRRSAAITIGLPRQARSITRASQRSALHAALRISTQELTGPPRITTGALTITLAPRL